MKMKQKWYWVLFVLLLAVVSGGGCNGSSSGGGSRFASAALEELDANGVPAIFGGIPGLRTEDYKLMGSDSTITLDSVPAAVLSITNPQPAPELSDSSIRAAEDSGINMSTVDEFTVKGLKKGVRYTIDIAKDLRSPFSYTPSITIFRIITEVPGFPDDIDGFKSEVSGEEVASVPGAGALENVPYHLTPAPEGDHAIVAATFVAPEDGDYVAYVSSTYVKGMPAEDILPGPYIFRIYVERGETPEMYGTPRVFLDNNGAPLTMTDLVMLRRALFAPSTVKGYVLKEGTDGKKEEDWVSVGDPLPLAGDDESEVQEYAPIHPRVSTNELQTGDFKVEIPTLSNTASEGNKKAVEAYNAELENISQQTSASVSGSSVRALADGEQRSRINPIIVDLPYTNDYTRELGIDAATGEQPSYALFEEAPDYQSNMNGAQTYTTSRLISNKKDTEDNFSIKNDLSINVSKVAIQNETEFQNNVKYSDLSATYWIHFEITARNYTDVAPSSLKLTQAAKEDIKRLSPSEFRKKYGDYYISAVRDAAQYDAYIQIKTNSVEKFKSIKNTLGVDIGSVLSNKNTIEKTLKEVSEGTEIVVNVKTLGKPKSGGAWTPPVNVDKDPAKIIEALFENMNKFMEQSMKSDEFEYEHKYYKLRRIKLLPGFESLSDEIEVEPELFKKIRTMMASRLDLTAKHGALQDISDQNLIDSAALKNQWKREFDELTTDTKTRLNEICKTVKSVEEWTKKIDDQAQKFYEILQRWSFYSSLLAEQNREQNVRVKDWEKDKDHFAGATENTPMELAWGYRSFLNSKLVHNELFSNTTHIYKKVRLPGGLEALGPTDVISNSYYFSQKYEESWGFWKSREWINTITLADMIRPIPPMKGHVFSYYQIWSSSNKDDIWRLQNPIVGRAKSSFRFLGGNTRSVRWRFYAVTINLSDTEKWPFTGLEGR